MSDFVLELAKTSRQYISDEEWIDKVVNYAQFLKQPLKLEMFIPCVNGEPFSYSKHGNKEQYEKAKGKVLFKYQPEFFDWGDSGMEDLVIEDLLNDELQYELTQNAIKQLEICENF